MVDITRLARDCPECGGARFWYGSVEFWVGGGRGSDDKFNAAVCSNCGYSSLYLHNTSGFRQSLAARGFVPPGGYPSDAPGTDPDVDPLTDSRPTRAEVQAFRKALREQGKSERR